MESQKHGFIGLVRGVAGAASIIAVLAAFWFGQSWWFALGALAVFTAAHAMHTRQSRLVEEKALAALPPAAAETVARRNMVSDFGAFLERAQLAPDEIGDQSTLPHPKDKLLDAIYMEITRTNDAAERAALKAGAILLANYQPDVGPRPLSQLGIGMAELEATDPSELARKIARNPMAARWSELNAKVEEELVTIQAKLAAAAKIGEAMSPEKKLQVFGM